MRRRLYFTRWKEQSIHSSSPECRKAERIEGHHKKESAPYSILFTLSSRDDGHKEVNKIVESPILDNCDAAVYNPILVSDILVKSDFLPQHEDE